MDIVTATLRDLGALRRLERACFVKDAWPFLDLVAVLSFPDIVRLKAMMDGQMVGFVAGDPRPRDGWAWVATIGVDPPYQRRGIGRALLHECETRLRLPRIRLTVRLSNTAAISMYEKEGYATIDIWKAYYSDGEDGLVMEKDLQQQA
jgi:ribosomal protein S18 acetylase RimI-like enzyme